MRDTITLQQKVKVLNKLFDAKCRTEKDLQGLSMESILKIPHHHSGYDGDYGASESNQIGQAVLLLRRWYR